MLILLPLSSAMSVTTFRYTGVVQDSVLSGSVTATQTGPEFVYIFKSATPGSYGGGCTWAGINDFYNCAVSSVPVTFSYVVTPNGDAEYKPFSKAKFSSTTCYLRVGVGYATGPASQEIKTMSFSPEFQENGNSYGLSSDTIRINKSCSAVTVADIGLLSGELSGHVFMGPTNKNAIWVSNTLTPFIASRGRTLYAYLFASGQELTQYTQNQATIQLNTGSTIEPGPGTPTICNLSGDLTIGHGVLGPQNIDGNKNSTELFLQCNAATTVKIKTIMLGNGSAVDLGGGINSNITLSNDTINVSQLEQKPFKVESTLKKVGEITPGEHSGNFALVLMYD